MAAAPRTFSSVHAQSLTDTDSIASVKRSDTARYAKFFHAMLERGVYLAPSAFEAGFVSLAHTKRDLDRTISAAKAILATL